MTDKTIDLERTKRDIDSKLTEAQNLNRTINALKVKVRNAEKITQTKERDLKEEERKLAQKQKEFEAAKAAAEPLSRELQEKEQEVQRLEQELKTTQASFINLSREVAALVREKK